MGDKSSKDKKVVHCTTSRTPTSTTTYDNNLSYGQEVVVPLKHSSHVSVNMNRDSSRAQSYGQEYVRWLEKPLQSSTHDRVRTKYPSAGQSSSQGYDQRMGSRSSSDKSDILVTTTSLPRPDRVKAKDSSVYDVKQSVLEEHAHMKDDDNEIQGQHYCRNENKGELEPEEGNDGDDGQKEKTPHKGDCDEENYEEREELAGDHGHNDRGSDVDNDNDDDDDDNDDDDNEEEDNDDEDDDNDDEDDDNDDDDDDNDDDDNEDEDNDDEDDDNDDDEKEMEVGDNEVVAGIEDEEKKKDNIEYHGKKDKNENENRSKLTPRTEQDEKQNSSGKSDKTEALQKDDAPKTTEVLVKITLPAAMDWQIVSDDLKSIMRNIKFKLKERRTASLHRDNFCISFSSRKIAKNAMYLIKTRRKLIKADLCENLIETCLKEILDEKVTALAIHQRKCDEITHKIMALQAGKKKNPKKNKFHSVEEFEKREALKQIAKEVNGQSTEFAKLIEELVQHVDSLRTTQDKDVSADINGIKQRLQREKDRIVGGLPIYAEKSRIIKTIKEHQVCIILGETGSGKSTQIVQYLYDAGFAEKGTIVCTQPRKVAAFSLAKRVSEELKDTKLVDCLDGTRGNRKSSKILFTTDHTLLMKCISDQDLSHFSCVIIDEAHERNINTDLLLGIIKKALPRRPDLRVIVTSATIDPSLFQTYFGGCPVIKVSGKLFPVEIEWKRKQQEDSKLDKSKDYVVEAVNKVVEIHRTGEEGDILVFLTCPAEIDRACSSVLSKTTTNDLVCLPLHGKLQQDDQRKVFDPTPRGKRKVVFSTNCAETSLTIPGIKFVVDSGRAKEMKYDPKRNLNSLEVSIISQSSANQRMGRAGRTDSGKCFRLYTEEDFNDMEKSSKPEILRVHLGQALLKLMELGISDPADFDYVESPPRDSITAAMMELVELEAIKDGNLTELGRRMVRVPVDPRLAKFLFEGFNQGVGYEALILVSVATVNGSVFFRMGTEEEKKEADVKKFEFCHLGGDFMTLLGVVRAWLKVDERDRSRWCCAKSLNAKAMRMANETVKDLKATLKRELKLDNIRWAAFDEETTDKIVQRTLFSCFLTKLCVYTGHERSGYQTVVGGHYVKVHPSSALKFMGGFPKFVIYEKILKTSQDFILNVTPIEEHWLRETMADTSLLRDAQQLVDEMMVQRTIMCSRALIDKTLLPFKEKLPQLESRVSKSCNGAPVAVEVNKQCGIVDVFISQKYAEKGMDIVQSSLEEGRKKLREETLEHAVEGLSSLRVVIQSGLTVQHVLMPGMYRTVIVRDVSHYTQDLYDCMITFGKVIDIGFSKQLAFVTYENPEDAMSAVHSSKSMDFEWSYSIQPKMNRQQHEMANNFNFVVKINWLRRESKDMANASFERCCATVPWYDFPSRWIRNVVIQSKKATVSADKFHPDSVFIRNLHPSSTKLDIKQALLEIFPDTPVEESNIIIQYKPREGVNIAAQSQKSVLERLISKHATPGTYNVSIKEFTAQNNKCPFANALVRFESPNEGMKMAQKLNGKHCKGLERWSVTLDVHPCLDFYYTCLKNVYDLVKNDVYQQFDEIEEECRRECGGDIKLNETPFGKPNSGRVKVSVETECIDHYMQASATITRAIQGEKYDCTNPPQRMVLLGPAGRDLLTSIQRDTGGLIYPPDKRTMALTIYGTSLQKEEAIDAVNKFVFELALSDSMVWEVNLKGPDKPRGLLKQIMSIFGSDLEGLCAIEGVSKVSKCIFKHVLTIHSTSDAKDVVLRRIEEIENSLSTLPQVKDDTADTSEECPICLCDVTVESTYRLTTCGHAYCTGCVMEQLKAAQFPMECANCSEKFAQKDMQNLLGLDHQELFNNTITKAIDSYLGANPDKARPCPSPNCQMVYLVTSEGKPFRCSVCSAATCTSCHQPYHLGMTCKEYDIDKKDPGAVEFAKWMRENPEERKRCPNCISPIERNQGCNHMQCYKCKKDFCWLCLRVFTSEDGFYRHQRNCHGNEEIGTE